jgi:hypothetical protein
MAEIVFRVEAAAMDCKTGDPVLPKTCQDILRLQATYWFFLQRGYKKSLPADVDQKKVRGVGLCSDPTCALQGTSLQGFELGYAEFVKWKGTATGSCCKGRGKEHWPWLSFLMISLHPATTTDEHARVRESQCGGWSEEVVLLARSIATALSNLGFSLWKAAV